MNTQENSANHTMHKREMTFKHSAINRGKTKESKLAM